MTANQEQDWLDELKQNPCKRCFKCDFTRDKDCLNPYKMCSVCSLIQSLAEQFTAHIQTTVEEAEKKWKANHTHIAVKYKAGQVYGQYLVIERLEPMNGEPMVLVECLYCHNEVKKHTRELKKGHHHCSVKTGTVSAQLTSPDRKDSNEKN